MYPCFIGGFIHFIHGSIHLKVIVIKGKIMVLSLTKFWERFDIASVKQDTRLRRLKEILRWLYLKISGYNLLSILIDHFSLCNCCYIGTVYKILMKNISVSVNHRGLFLVHVSYLNFVNITFHKYLFMRIKNRKLYDKKLVIKIWLYFLLSNVSKYELTCPRQSQGICKRLR